MQFSLDMRMHLLILPVFVAGGARRSLHHLARSKAQNAETTRLQAEEAKIASSTQGGGELRPRR